MICRNNFDVHHLTWSFKMLSREGFYSTRNTFFSRSNFSFLSLALNLSLSETGGLVVEIIFWSLRVPYARRPFALLERAIKISHPQYNIVGGRIQFSSKKLGLGAFLFWPTHDTIKLVGLLFLLVLLLRRGALKYFEIRREAPSPCPPSPPIEHCGYADFFELQRTIS